MFKILLCMVVIACSTTVGFSCSSKLYERKKILENFTLLLKNYSTQIRYNSPCLSTVFADNFMNYTFCDDKPFCEQWMQMLKLYSKVLSKDDIRLLSDFSKTVGTADEQSEQKNIEMYTKLLQTNIEKAKDDIAQKSKLYRTLGLSLGLVIAILLI